MSLNAFPTKVSEPETKCHLVQLEGAGAAAPTKVVGDGVTVTRTSPGLLLITWSENPGTLVGFSYGLGAATPADMEGHSVTRGVFSANALAISIGDAADAVDDLEADEYLDLQLWFTTTDA